MFAYILSSSVRAGLYFHFHCVDYILRSPSLFPFVASSLVLILLSLFAREGLIGRGRPFVPEFFATFKSRCLL